MSPAFAPETMQAMTARPAAHFFIIFVFSLVSGTCPPVTAFRKFSRKAHPHAKGGPGTRIGLISLPGPRGTTRQSLIVESPSSVRWVGIELPLAITSFARVAGGESTIRGEHCQAESPDACAGCRFGP